MCEIRLYDLHQFIIFQLIQNNLGIELLQNHHLTH